MSSNEELYETYAREAIRYVKHVLTQIGGYTTRSVGKGNLVKVAAISAQTTGV